MPTPYSGPVEVDIPLQIFGPEVGPLMGYVEIADIELDDWTTEFSPITPPGVHIHSGAATVRLMAEDIDNPAAPATLSGSTGSLHLRGQGRFLPEV